MSTLTYAGHTDRGRVRKRNEDNWFADPDKAVFIIADGMGGHAAGDVASGMVVEQLPRLLSEKMDPNEELRDTRLAERVSQAFKELNERVRSEGQRRNPLAGMGATAVLALIRDGQALIAHLGDSRAYLWSKGSMVRLTKDHSVIQQLLDSGRITPEEALTHPARGQITRCIGMMQEVDPDMRLIDLNPGDRLLLCTDGLTGMVSDQEIAGILEDHEECGPACHGLVEAANDAGGMDNIAVVLVNWKGEDE